MNDRDFEEYIAALCRRDGCTNVTRVGGAGDPGADMIGSYPTAGNSSSSASATPGTVGSRDIQTFNGTARAEHGADVPFFVASCKFTAPARKFAAKQPPTLVDIDLLGFWNSGTTLTSFLDLDIGRSGTHRKLHPER